MKDHEAVLRAKCLNGTLYRNDAKLSNWLGIPANQVQYALDQLVGEAVLRRDGRSSTGSERYKLGPSSDPFAPSQPALAAPWASPTRGEPLRLLDAKPAPPFDIDDPWDPNNPGSLAHKPGSR